MMNPLRLSTVTISMVPAPVLRSVALATGIVGLLATSGSEGLQTTGAAPRADISAPSSSVELAGTLQPSSQQPGSISINDLDQTQHDQTHVAMAEPSVAGDVADASKGNASIANGSIALNMPEPVVETAPINPPQAPPAHQAPPADHTPLADYAPPTDHVPAVDQVAPTEHVPPTEPAPAQVAAVNPQDFEFGSELGAILREADKTAKSIEFGDQCMAVESCVDQYLWTLYQRTPKEDTLKTVEWRDVEVERKVKVKGKTTTKMVTVSKAFTKLVEQDFGWKDPKAAERAGMPMMNYVIGGMDRSFKRKLFHMLRAAEAAGLSPGITSGFRDDYRQSIASGLKAASNRSYHGGSLRGGYGHGLAADVVSIQGATRDQRFASSQNFWKWVDAHGKEFGIARPYLGRDPPHVAPTDGEEYAKHNRGTRLAASDAKKVDLKKPDAKNANAKLAGSNAKDASIKQAASNAKKIDAKKPNLVIMRDSSSLANRVATRDVPPLSKRVTTRDASRPVKREAPRAASHPAKPVTTRDAARPAKRPKTATASKLKDS